MPKSNYYKIDDLHIKSLIIDISPYIVFHFHNVLRYCWALVPEKLEYM